MIFSIQNFHGKLTEREKKPKYYFADNGLIEILNRDPQSAQLENLVVLQLIRQFGLEDRVFYFSHNVELDFYIPEIDLGIQVSCQLDSESTLKREVAAFEKTNPFLSLKRKIILTLDNERTINSQAGPIDVIPIWKWLLTFDANAF